MAATRCKILTAFLRKRDKLLTPWRLCFVVRVCIQATSEVGTRGENILQCVETQINNVRFQDFFQIRKLFTGHHCKSFHSFRIDFLGQPKSEVYSGTTHLIAEKDFFCVSTLDCPPAAPRAPQPHHPISWASFNLHGCNLVCGTQWQNPNLTPNFRPIGAVVPEFKPKMSWKIEFSVCVEKVLKLAKISRKISYNF